MSEKNDNRPKQELVQTVARLTLEQRYMMVAGILLHQDVFITARQRLKPEYFDQADETYLRAAWQAALNLAARDQHKVLFENQAAAYTSMGVECAALLQAHPNVYLAAQAAALLSQDPAAPGFLHYVFAISKPSEFDQKGVARLLVDFLRERSINDELQRVARESAGKVITDVSLMMSKIRDRELDLAALDEDPVESAAPEGWMPPPSKRRRIGISWLDALLRGGHAAPETYGVLGVTGAGKTTLGLQIMSSVALQEQTLSGTDELAKMCREQSGLDPDEPYEMKHSYYFHYEMPRAEIRKKLWSNLAMIDLDRIEKLGTKNFDLSSSAELTPDEKEMLKFAAKQVGLKSEDFPGEKERLLSAIQTMQRNMWLVDCSGDDKNPRRGTAFVPEIHAILHNEVTRKRRKVGVVVIDYAGACVDRHTTDHEKHYQLLSQFGRMVEEYVSKPFDTPVWILHQLAAAEGGRTSAVKQNHANAGGSKRFAENLWFCFNIGTADPKTGCRFFTVSKARRANLGMPPIVKIAGSFNRIIDVSSVYKQNASGKFVERNEATTPKTFKPVEKDDDFDAFSENGAPGSDGDKDY